MRRLLAGCVLCSAFAQPNELRIEQIRLHQIEDGPSVERAYVFQAGSPAAVSFRIAGFSVDSESGEMHVAYSVTALDPEGVAAAGAKNSEVKYEVATEDKGWAPVARYQIYLPARARPGEYTFRIEAEDKRSGAKAAASAKFRVDARDVPASASFEVINFRFLRDGAADAPLSGEPVFAPGAPVFVAFDLTGFARAEKNRYRVSYGVELFGPSGKPLFSSPEAATESEEGFYPVTYAPGGFRFDLDAKTPPGRYRVVVRARDGIANQSIESERQFEVR